MTDEVGYKKPPKKNQFKKGNTASKGKGRPKIKPIREAFADLLSQEVDVKGGTKTRHELLLERIYSDAFRGKSQQQKMVLEFMHGKAEQTIDHKGEIKSAVSIYLPKKDEK